MPQTGSCLTENGEYAPAELQKGVDHANQAATISASRTLPYIRGRRRVSRDRPGRRVPLAGPHSGYSELTVNRLVSLRFRWQVGVQAQCDSDNVDK